MATTPAPVSPPAPPRAGVVVEVSDTQNHIPIDRGRLAGLVRGALGAQGVTLAGVSVAVVDDATIAGLNRRHLGHEGPTDVITFGLSDPGGPELSGELVVSAETALRAARGVGVDPWDELALYVVHGLLHLCGYDDLGDGDRAAMRRREGFVLSRLGLPNTFGAAAPAPATAEPGPRRGVRE